MSFTEDSVTGISKVYQPHDYKPSNKPFEVKKCVCIFFMSAPNEHGQLIRRYTHVAYFDSLNQDEAKKLDHRGASPVGFYLINASEEQGKIIADDINANKKLFY